jgi:glycosyltransferase involved in cell wall biosynthesis
LQAFQPELLHSHCFHSNLFARMLRATGFRGGVINTVHNVYEGPWLRMQAYRWSDGWADRVTAVCAAAARRYVTLGAVSAKKLSVVANAFELEALEPDAERREQARDRMGIYREFVWLSVGRLTEAKDPQNLLRAFCEAGKRFPDARLWMAGEGEGAFAEGMKELATRLGVGDRVQWLGEQRDIPLLLDAADGFVLGSAWEGMPLAIGEAMAMAKPVVATDVGGVGELMGETGTLVDAGDAAALARGMCAVVEMPEEARRRAGETARRRVAAEFDMERRAQEWEALYGQVLGSGDGRAD